MSDTTFTQERLDCYPTDQAFKQTHTIDSEGKAVIRTTVSDSGPSSGYVEAWLHTKIEINNTTATLVPATNLTNRKTVEIYNSSSETVYVGPTSGVTAANGRPIFANETWNVDLGESLSVYAISSTSTFDLDVTEFA